MDFLAVEGGSFATRCAEKFIVKRIEDHRGEKRIALGKSDRNTETGIAVGKIGSAVERVDVPAKLRSGCALVPGSLFGGNRVVGKVFSQALDDEPFRPLVCLRDEIDFVAFVPKLERARQFLHQGFSGFLRNCNCYFQIGIVHPVNITVECGKFDKTN